MTSLLGSPVKLLPGHTLSTAVHDGNKVPELKIQDKAKLYTLAETLCSPMVIKYDKALQSRSFFIGNRMASTLDHPGTGGLRLGFLNLDINFCVSVSSC